MSQLVMCNADRGVMRCGLMVNVFRQSEEYDDSKQLTVALVSLSRVEWQQARVEYRSLVRSKEKNYWSRCIADAVSQPCRSWNLLKCLLRPSDIKPKFNQDEFAQFFHFKVQSIRDSIAGSEFRVVSHPTRRRFPAFRNVTTNQEVSRLIGRCPSSQCSLDPALTSQRGLTEHLH